MTWIRDEVRRYDQSELVADLENKFQVTINNIHKEQRQQISEEQLQARKLTRIDGLHRDLALKNERLTVQSDKLTLMRKKIEAR